MSDGMGFSVPHAGCVQHAAHMRVVAQAKASGTGMAVGFSAMLALVRARMFANARSHANRASALAGDHRCGDRHGV
jgi:hypothetical protein